MQSDRELENFFPETMKTPSSYSWENSKPRGASSQNSSKNNYNMYGGPSNGYNEQSYRTGMERKTRGRKEPSWAQNKLYDDRSDTGFKYAQPKENVPTYSATMQRSDTVKIKNFAKTNLPMSISSETFQTSSSSNGIIRKTVISRRDISSDTTQAQERITILKPNGLAKGTPIILARAKTEAPTILKSANSRFVTRVNCISLNYIIYIVPLVTDNVKLQNEFEFV